MALPQMITAKLKELDLAPTAAAEKFGIAYPSFAAVTNGKSLPNARTFKKYGKLLGISEGDVQRLVETAKGKGGAKRGGGKAGGGKRRGRPPGRRNSGGSLARTLADAAKMVAEAEAILGDDLAVQVHRLPKAKRRMLEAVLGA